MIKYNMLLWYKVLQYSLVVINIYCLGWAFYVHLITVRWQSYFNWFHCLVRKEKGWNLIVPSPSISFREVVRTHLNSMKKFIINKHSERERERGEARKWVWFVEESAFFITCKVAAICMCLQFTERNSYLSSLGIKVFTAYSSKPRSAKVLFLW